MKTIFYALIGLGLLLGSCTQAETESILPETKKLETCHLKSEAIIEYSEAGHTEGGTQIFYYLVLLENGKRGEDVYAGKLAEDLRVLGKKIQVIYHFDPRGNHTYFSACGNGPNAEPVQESMRAIVVCEIGEGLF